MKRRVIFKQKNFIYVRDIMHRICYVFIHSILFEKKRTFFLISKMKEKMKFNFILKFNLERLMNENMIVSLLTIQFEE